MILITNSVNKLRLLDFVFSKGDLKVDVKVVWNGSKILNKSSPVKLLQTCANWVYYNYEKGDLLIKL